MRCLFKNIASMFQWTHRFALHPWWNVLEKISFLFRYNFSGEKGGNRGMPFYEAGSTASLHRRVRRGDHGQSLCFCTQHRPTGVHRFDSSYRAYGCRSLTTPSFLLLQKKFHLCTSPYLVSIFRLIVCNFYFSSPQYRYIYAYQLHITDLTQDNT